MTLYATLLFTLATISFAAVLMPSMRLPGVTELGLALVGLGALGGGIKALEGEFPTLHVITLAASGALISALGMLWQDARQQRRNDPS